MRACMYTVVENILFVPFINVYQHCPIGTCEIITLHCGVDLGKTHKKPRYNASVGKLQFVCSIRKNLSLKVNDIYIQFVLFFFN
jgi:hypothetical protein